MSLSSSFVILSKSAFFLLSLFVTISSQAEAATSTPLVLYNFTAGNGSEIYDVSGNGKPLNLKISDTGNIRWLQGGGLTVEKATLISATSPARKITDAIKANNALTIEAWIQPASKNQIGPARIITLSADTHNRNLTIGQDKAGYDARLRTTKTNDNGTPSLSSSESVVDTNLTHVVYTRNSSGRARLYINGVLESKKRISGKLDSWDSSYMFALANEVTGDRPWTGTFYQVAIYGQALSEPEVDQSFTSGPNNEGHSSSYQADQSTIGNTDSATTDFSDPIDTTSSGTFSETGSVFLSWSAPVARSNGEALAMNEIEGYTLYYGNTAGIYSDSININDPYTTSTTIADLPLDSYYFVITARDITGRQSGYSSMLKKPVL